MLYNTKQSYTLPLERHEFTRHSLIIDTETVGSGPLVEIVEIALGDTEGNIIFHSLVHPVFNRIPRSSKLQRFEKAEFDDAPDWMSVWAQIEPMLDSKLLIAYNAAFDRRAMSAMYARHRHTSRERGWRCAMQFVRQAIGTRRSLTLEEACAHYGLEGGNHRARRDVEATYKLLKSLISPS
jgi:DNA polymerase-3 subunit epsilon